MIYASYDAPEQLVSAIHALRGKARLEAYTPYPNEAVIEALQLPRSRIPLLAFTMGLGAAALTYLLQWYITAYSYPIDVGGRPPHFPLSFVPICFEMGMLSAALTALTAVAVLDRLGQLWDPVFELPGFASATRDQHWLRVDWLRVDGDVRAALEQTSPSRIVEAP